VDAAVRVEEIQKIYELVRSKIENTNASYQAQANKHMKKVVFQPGELLWIHLRKERFFSKRKNKPMPRADGPFEVLEKIDDNAYKVDLPRDYRVSPTFNVANLSAYQADDYLEDFCKHQCKCQSPSNGSNLGKEPNRSNRDEQPKFTRFCSFDFLSYIVA